MSFVLRVLSSFMPLFFVACYAPVPVVSTPLPEPATQKSPSDMKKDPNTKPPEVSAPQDVIANLTFTERLSWSLSGHTPSAAWSPNRSQLVFLSEYEKSPANKHKKYVEVADLNTGEIKQVTTILGTSPVWLNEESLLFVCGQGTCGKNKSGVYLLNLKTKAQSKLFSIQDNDYSYVYPLKDGTIFMNTERQEGKEPNINFIFRWDRWDPATKTLTQREGKAAKYFIEKQGIPEGGCTYNPDVSVQAKQGTLFVMNYNTKAKKTILSAAPLPKYPGDRDGIFPCLAPEVDQLIYYTFDATTKRSVAKLMKIGGYTKPAPPKPPAKDMIHEMKFSELFSWNISGHTPIASWSPDKSQLVFVSDVPKKIGAPKDGKKYIEIADLKAGTIKSMGIISATQHPLWFDNETIVFVCERASYCGKGKLGAYMLNISKGTTKQLASLDKDGSAGFYTSEGNPLIFTSGNGPESTTRWYEWDPATQKVSPRDDVLGSGNKIKRTALPMNFCQTRTLDLTTFAESGEMGITNNKNAARRVVASALPLPYFEEDPDGVAPCLSPEVDTMIYYSRDASTKSNKATLMKVTGYLKQ